MALRQAPMAMARDTATMGVMHRHTMAAVMPPLTTEDIRRRIMTIMHPHITVTVTGEFCVQHSPTTVVPPIMAVGVTGGIVIGNSD